jgi:ATP-dependent RNA helicase RhlE
MHPTFHALGVSDPIARVLSKRGIDTPFAVQALVLPDALAGLDVVAESPTGSGKTLAFGIPLLERTPSDGRRPTALVLVPTRELASQVVDELAPLGAAKGLRVAAVYGGTPVAAQAKRARGANVLVATPGRLQDLIDQRLVSLDAVRVLVLDEADRMLDMGFRPQVDRILRTVPENRQTLLFSATLGDGVDELARAYTVNPVHVQAGAPAEAERGTIEHAFVSVTPEDKLERLVEHLRAEGGLSLVFVRTKHGADKLARKLVRQHDVAAVAMHGNMTQNARQRALSQFGSGRISTLVATDVAARGLDVDDVAQVINFDPPRAAEDYVHRVGRTGRAGRSGSGVTLVLPDQQHDVGRMAAALGRDDDFAASGMRPPRPAQAAAGNGSSSSGRRRRRRR